MTRHPAAILFIGFLALYLLTMGGHLYSPDEEIMFQTTKAIAERGSLAIERPKEMPPFAVRIGVDGREYAQYGVGQPLLAVPFYLLGRALAERAGDQLIGFSLIQYHDRSPREEWQRFGVSLFNQFVAALLVTLLFALAADLTGDRTAAALTAILYGAGTMAWVHSKPFFSESLATLLIFSAFALLVRARLYRRPWWNTLAGCAAGYALLTRLDSLFAFPALGVLLVWPEEPLVDSSLPPPKDEESKRGGPGISTLGQILRDPAAVERLGRFLPPVVLACLIILGLNRVRYGSPFSTGYETQPEGIQFINPLLVGLYGFLFSIGKGLFFFSPPLVLFFFAIRRFVRQAPPAGWACVVLVATLLLIHSKWINWAGGWCWGPRHIFMAHIFLALPICGLLMVPRGPIVRIAYVVLLICGIAVQLYGTSQNFIDYYFVAFRNPLIAPNATVRYHPEDAQVVQSFYEVRMIVESPVKIDRVIWPGEMPAPVGDSIWRIESSPWGIYKKLWREGFHDYFWLERLGYRSRAHAVEWLVQAQGGANKEKQPGLAK